MTTPSTPTPDSAGLGEPIYETILSFLSDMDAEAMPNEKRAGILAALAIQPNDADRAWATGLIPTLPPVPDSAGWIEWRGGECPVTMSALVESRLRSGDLLLDLARNFDWSWDRRKPHHLDIIAYRLSDRLADERSELADHIVDANEKVPPDQSALAGAIERLWQWVEMGGPRCVSQWPEIARDLRALLGSTEGRDDG